MQVKSIMKEDLEYFLPLYIHKAHGQEIKGTLEATMKEVRRWAREPRHQQPPYLLHTMAAGDLATWGAWASAGMVLKNTYIVCAWMSIISRYHGYWCPGDVRNWGISRHGIECWRWPGDAISDFRFTKCWCICHAIDFQSRSIFQMTQLSRYFNIGPTWPAAYIFSIMTDEECCVHHTRP